MVGADGQSLNRAALLNYQTVSFAWETRQSRPDRLWSLRNRIQKQETVVLFQRLFGAGETVAVTVETAVR